MSENLFLGDSTYPHAPSEIKIMFPESAQRNHVQALINRIEQLECELADAKNLSDLDAIDLAVGRQINRAARDLPMWFEIVISIEKDAGDVVMTDPDGNEFGNFEGDSFAWQISKAIDAAINGVKA